MRNLCATGCTVVIASHGLHLLRSLADGYVWLDHGRVRAVGGTESIVDAYLVSTGVRAEEPVFDD
jgi:ABC-type polysaccharide/polyol phosphate transport system ATPase subunit